MKTHSSDAAHHLIDREIDNRRITIEAVAKAVRMSMQTVCRARSGSQGDLGWRRMLRILDFCGYEVIIRRKKPAGSRQ